MKLIDIIQRSIPPKPWEEGEKIPWSDPDFSIRMLQEHLSQNHDAASRRNIKISRHVDWLNELAGDITSILDLGCGPGLYTSLLAEKGHTCVGIDYAPASIQYAREFAEDKNLDCIYIEEDIRSADYGNSFGLAMLIYGELNVFRSDDAELILKKTYQALNPGGILVLELHTFDCIKRIGQDGIYWHAVDNGLFADQPYLYLEENYWSEEDQTTTNRYYIIDMETGNVSRYASSYQAYSDQQYRTILEEIGFHSIETYPSMDDGESDDEDFFVLTAKK